MSRLCANDLAAMPRRDPSHLSKQPRLPCCTCLLRVFVNPTEDDALHAINSAGVVAKFDEGVRDAEEVARSSPLSPFFLPVRTHRATSESRAVFYGVI